MYEHLLSEYLLARYGPTVQSLPEQAFWPLAIYSVQDSFADGQAGEVELRAVNDNKRALVNTLYSRLFSDTRKKQASIRIAAPELLAYNPDVQGYPVQLVNKAGAEFVGYQFRAASCSALSNTVSSFNVELYMNQNLEKPFSYGSVKITSHSDFIPYLFQIRFNSAENKLVWKVPKENAQDLKTRYASFCRQSTCHAILEFNIIRIGLPSTEKFILSGHPVHAVVEKISVYANAQEQAQNNPVAVFVNAQ